MAQAASEVPSLLRLHLVEGPQSGKQLEKKGTSLRVGRTTKSPLYIKDPSISEAHAELVWEGGAWQLRDLGSTNGTALNGKQLVGEPSEFVALKDGDLIKFGTDTLARVEVAAPPSDEQTVEEFVLQECGQLEQRIRCVCGGVQCGVAGSGWPGSSSSSSSTGFGVVCRAVNGSCRQLRMPGVARFYPINTAWCPRLSHCCRARAEQISNQLRQDWQEQKQTLLMSG
jgi:hypothetical protein